MAPPLVSVCMITYNHEQYIAEAIESVLCQETDFPFELIIGEDYSTDNTRQICEAYAEKYPDIITLLPSPKNYGIQENFVRTYNECAGKYIAMLEGDDYWIDSSKLQKQVTQMEMDDSLSMCYSNVTQINETLNSTSYPGSEHPEKVNIEYILTNGWFIRTATILLRKEWLEIPEFFFTAYSTDYIIHILMAKHGPILRIPDNTAVYRIHPEGISLCSDLKQLQRWDEKKKLLFKINQWLGRNFEKEIKIQISDLNYVTFRKIWSSKTIENNIFMAMDYLLRVRPITYYRLVKRKVCQIQRRLFS